MIKEINTSEEAVKEGLKPEFVEIILCDTLDDMLEYKSQHKWKASFQYTNGKYIVFPNNEVETK
jgi:hypothetical protein